MPAVETFDIGYNIDVDNTTFFWSINNVFDKSYERPDGYNQYDRNINLGCANVSLGGFWFPPSGLLLCNKLSRLSCLHFYARLNAFTLLLFRN